MNEGGKFQLHVYLVLGQPMLAPAPYIRLMINLKPFNLPEDGDHDKPCPQPGLWLNSCTAKFFFQ
jgi:hypothetical protein